jgi:hypothetical protein
VLVDRPLTWRHARADTSNFDRGLVPVEADAALDLRALRSASAYGLVAMACLVAHNDRLLAPTTVLAPLDRLAAADLAAAGFSFVVHEFLCPVQGRFDELEAADGARRRAPALPSWCPDPGGDLVLAVHPVHDRAEEDAAAEAISAGLVDVARAQRIDLVLELLRATGSNRRRHAGTFDAYVAARLVDGGGELAVEIAVGDVGVGLRYGLAAVSKCPVADDAEAVDAVLGGWRSPAPRGAAPPPWSAAARGHPGAEEKDPGSGATPGEAPPARPAGTARGSAPCSAGSAQGPLARLFAQVVDAGGMVVVRSGTARHGRFATGTTRAVVPAVRGTIVSCRVPVGRATRLRRVGPVGTASAAPAHQSRVEPRAAAGTGPCGPAQAAPR